MKGKIVIVTGGSRGTGKETCKAFGNQGANIVIVANNSYKEAEGLAK